MKKRGRKNERKGEGKRKKMGKKNRMKMGREKEGIEIVKRK